MELLIRRAEQVSMVIAIFAVALIVIVVSLDAILRYGFNSPLQWASELVRYYLMVVGIYFAVSSTFTHGDHVNITFLSARMSPRLRAWANIVWCLMAALVFAVITWGTWGTTLHAWEQIEFIPGYFIWPSWLSHLAIPLGCALLVLRLLHHAAVLAINGRDASVSEEGETLE